MTITINKKNAPKQSGSGIVSSNPNLNRHGAWGIVREVYGEDHSADVLIDSGVLIYHIPVSSKAWVCPGDTYTCGERDLPPVGARVFVLMPTGNFDGCFVLCSGFVVTDKAQEDAFLGEGKENIRKHVSPGNWKTESHDATGTYEIVSPDERTSLKINYGTEDEPKDAPELHLTIFDQIACDVISDDTVRLSVFDSVLTLKSGAVSIASGGKVYLGGSADNIGALLLALVDELIGFQTMGPPPQHVTHPQTITKLNAFKEKIRALFLEASA